MRIKQELDMIAHIAADNAALSVLSNTRQALTDETKSAIREAVSAAVKTGIELYAAIEPRE